MTGRRLAVLSVFKIEGWIAGGMVRSINQLAAHKHTHTSKLLLLFSYLLAPSDQLLACFPHQHTHNGSPSF